MFIMDDEQSDVGHGCPFSAVTSNTLLFIEEKRLLAATGESREGSAFSPLWVSSPLRQITNS